MMSELSSEWMTLGNVLEQHSSFFFSVWKWDLYISCKKTDIARTICFLLKSNILMEITSVTAEYAAQCSTLELGGVHKVMSYILQQR